MKYSANADIRIGQELVLDGVAVQFMARVSPRYLKRKKIKMTATSLSFLTSQWAGDIQVD